MFPFYTLVFAFWSIMADPHFVPSDSASQKSITIITIAKFTEFFWTFSIVLYSKKHDVSETGSVSVLR
jgi:hypothetical protein